MRRVAGKKAVMDEVKRHDGHLVEVVGIVKRSDLDEQGVKVGRVTIGPGAPASGTRTIPSPADNVPWVAAKAFEASVQKLGKALFYQGDVSYLEAVNQATLSNAFLRLVEAGVLLTRKSDTNVNLMALHPDWLPTRTEDGGISPSGKLWDFLSRLSAFRREGKNRRCVHCTCASGTELTMW